MLMTRSSTFRCAAGFLLAATLLLPATAKAESPRGWLGGAPAESASFVAGLWESLVQLLPGEWRPATTDATGDNGWQIDPDGDYVPTGPSADNGWQIDPNG
jgi:hypothetical protein